MKSVCVSLLIFFILVFLLPSNALAENVPIFGVLSAKTEVSRGEVFETQLQAAKESPDLVTNLVINGTEYFAAAGGGACRSDNNLFLGWIKSSPPVARIACTIPSDITNGASIELIGYQFRNCDKGEKTCGMVKSTQKITLKEEPVSKPTPESSANIAQRVGEEKSALQLIFESLFGTKSVSTTSPNSSQTTGNPTNPSSSGTTQTPKTGASTATLTLNSTAATTECLMMHVAANYGHPGENRDVNAQCQVRTRDRKYADECIPWELLGAIQEKETGLPGEGDNFSASAAEVVENVGNACSVLVGACPTSGSSYAGGDGGAMGISQFIPGTWEGHKDSVFEYESGKGYTAGACDPNSSSFPVKVGKCAPGANCSAADNYRVYSHPCNVMAALYAMAHKLQGDSGRSVCKSNGWTENDVYNAAGSYFGMCEYHGNAYCADIVSKMKDKGYIF